MAPLINAGGELYNVVAPFLPPPPPPAAALSQHHQRHEGADGSYHNLPHFLLSHHHQCHELVHEGEGPHYSCHILTPPQPLNNLPPHQQYACQLHPLTHLPTHQQYVCNDDLPTDQQFESNNSKEEELEIHCVLSSCSQAELEVKLEEWMETRKLPYSLGRMPRRVYDGLKRRYSNLSIPCRFCNLTTHTKFRFFNNMHTQSTLLQPRFKCHSCMKHFTLEKPATNSSSLSIACKRRAPSPSEPCERPVVAKLHTGAKKISLQRRTLKKQTQMVGGHGSPCELPELTEMETRCEEQLQKELTSSTISNQCEEQQERGWNDIWREANLLCADFDLPDISLVEMETRHEDYMSGCMASHHSSSAALLIQEKVQGELIDMSMPTHGCEKEQQKQTNSDDIQAWLQQNTLFDFSLAESEMMQMLEQDGSSTLEFKDSNVGGGHNQRSLDLPYEADDLIF